MSVSAATQINETDITLTMPAQSKMVEILGQVEEKIEGIRLYAAPGGCSGISFGMTFADQVNDNDAVFNYDGFNIIVDDGTLGYLRGVEIDFIDRDDGGASFVFNNLQPMNGAAGCGTCGSQGGGCG